MGPRIGSPNEVLAGDHEMSTSGIEEISIIASPGRGLAGLTMTRRSTPETEDQSTKSGVRWIAACLEDSRAYYWNRSAVPQAAAGPGRRRTRECHHNVHHADLIDPPTCPVTSRNLVAVAQIRMGGARTVCTTIAIARCPGCARSVGGIAPRWLSRISKTIGSSAVLFAQANLDRSDLDRRMGVGP